MFNVVVHTSSGDRLPIVTRLFTWWQQKAWLTLRSTSSPGSSRLVFRYGRLHIRKREDTGDEVANRFLFSRVCVVTDDASKQQRIHEVREYNR